MWNYNHANELRHYGVLGMKWGKRRSEAELARARKSKGKSDVADMSDDELRRKVNRLQLEQQYSKLTGTDVSKGKQYVKKVIGAATATAAVTTTALTLYNNAGKIKRIVKSTASKVGKAGA